MVKSVFLLIKVDLIVLQTNGFVGPVEITNGMMMSMIRGYHFFSLRQDQSMFLYNEFDVRWLLKSFKNPCLINLLKISFRMREKKTNTCTRAKSEGNWVVDGLLRETTRYSFDVPRISRNNRICSCGHMYFWNDTMYSMKVMKNYNKKIKPSWTASLSEICNVASQSMRKNTISNKKIAKWIFLVILTHLYSWVCNKFKIGQEIFSKTIFHIIFFTSNTKNLHNIVMFWQLFVNNKYLENSSRLKKYEQIIKNSSTL